MPTREERLDTLEKKTTAAIQEIDEENTTIMLGVIRHQGQDIKKIFQRLETMETKLDKHTTLLTQILARLPGNP